MASRLLSGSGMKTLFLLIALFTAPLGAAAQTAPAADGTTVESVEVTGLDLSQLSPGLRLDITALAGKPLTRDYFRIACKDGGRFWLYREGLYHEAAAPRWFVHGMFA